MPRCRGKNTTKLPRNVDRYSQERARFAAEYDRFVDRWGGQAGDTGHGGGPMRRGWSDLEARIRPRQDVELATFAADGDQGGLKHFERALTLDFLPDEVRETVRRHHCKDQRGGRFAANRAGVMAFARSLIRCP